jgi:hypothetical protein
MSKDPETLSREDFKKLSELVEEHRDALDLMASDHSLSGSIRGVLKAESDRVQGLLIRLLNSAPK